MEETIEHKDHANNFKRETGATKKKKQLKKNAPCSSIIGRNRRNNEAILTSGWIAPTIIYHVHRVTLD